MLGLAQNAGNPNIKVPVALTEFFGLTTTTVIDNRSPTTHFNNIHLMQATGTGTWSVQLQYSDTASTGPFTNFTDPTSVLSNTSLTSTGGAYGYHAFIRLLVTGTATVNYSGTQNLYIPFGGQGGSGSLQILTNGSPNISQTTLNFQATTFNGLTLTPTNPSGGIEQFVLSGSLGNAGLANSSITFVVPSWMTLTSPASLGSTATLAMNTGQTAHQVIGTGTGNVFGPMALGALDIPAALSNTTSVNGTAIPSGQTLLYAGGPLGTPSSGVGTNLTGIPLGTGILATISAPLQLSGNTLSAPTAVVAVSPGLGLAHFAGGTQTVTSSLVSLTADVTGILPAINHPLASSSALGIVQGDGSTITINGSGVESCTTATTSQIGCVKPDGTTITIIGGTISAVTGSINIGAAITGGATPGNILVVGAGPVLSQEARISAPQFPALNQDVTNMAGSLTMTVMGIDAIPLCTGFSPTVGQTVEYTAAASPNPCWTAASIIGGGNVSTSGSPSQYQIPVWVSGTTIGGITPSSNSGVPLISQGLGANPVFGAINLAGVGTIVTGVTLPQSGGTGVNNGASTITIGGNVAVSGAFTLGITLTGNTSVTFPTSGLLSTTTGTVTNLSVSAGLGGLIAIANPTTTPTLSLTGVTSGGVPCFTSTSAWASSALMVSGQFMLGGGAGNCPSTSFSVVPLVNGGTNAGLSPSNGGLVFSTGSALAILAGTSTANQIPLSGSNAVGSWSTATYPATTTINQLLYSSTANTITGLATANNAVLVTGAGGVPLLSTTLPNGLAMGTPVSINLSNATAYPVATGSTFGIVKPDNTSITILGGVISSTGSVNVNGTPASSPNFNGTTPAAGTGYSLLNWQISGSNVSAEVQCGSLLIPFGAGCAGDATQIITRALGTAGTPWSLQATSSGAGVTIAASAPTGMVSYTDNSFFNMKLTDSNSGASCTLNIGTLGPVALVKLVGVTVTACAAGDIQENEPILLNYTSNGGLGGAAAFLYTPQGANGATGTVTSFSAGGLSPLFTTSVATATSTPALSFTLSNAGQNTVLAGPPTGGAGPPTYQTAPTISAANMTNLPITLTTTGACAAATYTQSTNALNIPICSGGTGGSGQINYPIADQTQLLPVGLSQQTAVTVTGTTAATTVLGVFAGRNSIPAGTMLASGSGLKTIRVHGVGTVTTASTNFGVTLTFLLGGNTLSSITVPTTLSLTGAGFDFDYEFTVSGLTTAVGGGKACGNIGTSNTFACGYASSASITGLNFAVSQNVDIQVTPQSSSDSVTINELSVSPVFTL
jgi:hypothetical protein